MRDQPRHAAFRHRRPARQSGQRGAGPGARRADIHGHRPAVETDHGQSVARRSAQRGVTFRPAHRAGLAGRTGYFAIGRGGTHRGPGGIIAQRQTDPGDRRIARRDVCRARGTDAAVPQGLRRRSGLGWRHRGHCGGNIGRSDPALYRPTNHQPLGAGRGATGTWSSRPARCQRPGTGETGAGNCRRRAAPYPDDRLAGVGQIHAGGPYSGDHAALDGGRSAGNLDDPFTVRVADRRWDQPGAAVPRPAPHRIDGSNCGGRAQCQTRRNLAGA